MEFIDVSGYSFAFIIGVLMGLVGAGGSLMMPVMIYIFLIEETLATGYALFLVGITASFGAIKKIQQGELDYRLAALLGFPMIVSTLYARMYLIHAIPEYIILMNIITIERKTFIMVLFAIMLLLSALSMTGIWKPISGDNGSTQDGPWEWNRISGIISIGAIIGVLAGLVGAGGGILLVPVLVIFLKFPMKTAVGTSLMVIAVKSISGFAGDIYILGDSMEWKFLLTLSSLMISGIFVGIYLSSQVPGQRLKVVFGWIMMAMVSFICYRELILPLFY